MNGQMYVRQSNVHADPARVKELIRFVGQYSFYVDVSISGEAGSHNSMLGIQAYARGDKKAPIGYKCKWFRVTSEGRTYHMPHVSGSSYQLNANDIGFALKVEVTSTDETYIGECHVFYGPITLDTATKGTLDCILTSGQTKFPVTLIDCNTNKERTNCTLTVLPEQVEVWDQGNQNYFNFSYTFDNPTLDTTTTTDPTRLQVSFNPLTTKTSWQEMEKSSRVGLRFASKQARDTFLLALRCFAAKTYLIHNHIWDRILTSHELNIPFLSLELANIKKELHYFVEKSSNLKKENDALKKALKKFEEEQQNSSRLLINTSINDEKLVQKVKVLEEENRTLYAKLDENVHSARVSMLTVNEMTSPVRKQTQFGRISGNTSPNLIDTSSIMKSQELLNFEGESVSMMRKQMSGLAKELEEMKKRNLRNEAEKEKLQEELVGAIDKQAEIRLQLEISSKQMTKELEQEIESYKSKIALLSAEIHGLRAKTAEEPSQRLTHQSAFSSPNRLLTEGFDYSSNYATPQGQPQVGNTSQHFDTAHSHILSRMPPKGGKSYYATPKSHNDENNGRGTVYGSALMDKSNLLEEVTVLKSKLKDFEDEKQKLIGRVNILTLEITALRAESEEKLKDGRDEVKNLHVELAHQKTVNQALETEIEYLKKQAGAGKQSEKLEEKVAQLKLKNEELEKSLRNLEKIKEEKEELVSRLKKELDNMRKDLDTLRTDLIKKEQFIMKLRDEVERVKSRESDLHGRYERLTREKDILESELEEYKEKSGLIERLTHQLEENNQELSATKEECNSLQTHRQKEREDLHQKIAVLKQEIAELTQERNDLASKLRESETELASLKKAWNEKMIENEKVLEELAAEVSKLKSELLVKDQALQQSAAKKSVSRGSKSSCNPFGDDEFFDCQDIDQLREDIQMRDKEISRKTDEITKLLAAVDELIDRAGNLEKELTSIMAENEEMKQAHIKVVTDYKKGMEKIQKEKDELSNEMKIFRAESKGKISKYEDEIEKLQNSCGILKAEMVKAQQERNLLQFRQEKSQDIITRLEQEKTALQAKIEDFEKIINLLKQEMAAIEKENDELRLVHWNKFTSGDDKQEQGFFVA